MDFLIDFKKLFGRKIISLFIWLYVYCFLFSLDFNFFICSYLRVQLFNIETNIFILLNIILFTFIYLLNKKLYLNNSKIKNFLKLDYIYLILKTYNLYNLSILFFKSIINNINNVIITYLNKKLINLISFITLNFLKKNLLWYPIYKSYSIFGYYKSTRLKFVDIKNENLKRLKY